MTLQTAYNPDCDVPEYVRAFMRDFREAVLKSCRERGVLRFLFNLIFNKIGSIETRILAVIARVRAGTLRPLRPREPRDPAAPPRPPRPKRPPPVAPPPAPPPAPTNPDGEPQGLKRGFGWLRRMGINPGAVEGRIQHLLADPKMRELIAADPRVAREFRPLFWMLGMRYTPEQRPAPGEVAQAPILVEIPVRQKPGKPTPFVPPPPPAQPDAYGHTRGDPKPSSLSIWGRGLVKG